MANACENIISFEIPGDDEPLTEELIKAIENEALLEFLSPVEHKESDPVLLPERQREQWGTKSDLEISDKEISKESSRDKVSTINVEGFTDWGPPLKALQDFVKAFPQVSVSCKYCEPSSFIGTWHSGEVIGEHEHQEIPSDPQKICEQIWRDDIERFGILDLDSMEDEDESDAPGM